MKKYDLDGGIVKVCAGLVESVSTEPYTSAIAAADKLVGQNYFASNAVAQHTRAQLVEAIKRNLINRKENPYIELRRTYGLPISYRQFTAEKRRYCWEIAQRLNLIQQRDGSN